MQRIKEPVLFCGDIHGHFDWVAQYIMKNDINHCSVIICGDVGLGFSPIKKQVQEMKKCGLADCLKRQSVQLYLVRGNHDDPSLFDGRALIGRCVYTVKDYTVLKSEHHNILCVGGGVSMDRICRQADLDEQILSWLETHPESTRTKAMKHCSIGWWPDEYPVFNQEAIDDLDCKVDIVCSHTAPEAFLPTPLESSNWFKNDSTLKNDLIRERHTMQQVLDRLILKKHPITKWFFGHFHRYISVSYNNLHYALDYCCLDKARDGNLCIKELL